MFFDTYVLQFMTNLKKVVVKLLKRKNSKKEGKFMRHFATTYKKNYVYIYIDTALRLYITQTPRQKRIEVASKNQENIAAKVRQGDKISLLFFTFAKFSLRPVRPSIHPSISFV